MNNSFLNNSILQGSSLQPGFTPAWNPYFAPASNQTNIAKVNGLESVKACATVPQSRMVYFDADEDIFYIKETDINNYPTIRAYRFEEMKSPEASKTVEYVTIEEFNKFKEEVLNGKQYIREYASADTTSDADARHYAASTTDTEYYNAGKQSSANVAKPDKPKPSV
jgi:hypothetical protein